MCFYLSIFLVNNTIFCKEYCCECCKVRYCYENDNEESKKNADFFRERLLMSTLTYTDYVLEQLKPELNQQKKKI